MEVLSDLRILDDNDHACACILGEKELEGLGKVRIYSSEDSPPKLKLWKDRFYALNKPGSFNVAERVDMERGILESVAIETGINGRQQIKDTQLYLFQIRMFLVAKDVQKLPAEKKLTMVTLK